ncbi:dephospho-CoA kinase [Planctomicrobium sp.]|jgi:dephospho-CoA kinase|nr:dephospho-CoA kinase [Planctomicrobium sp.]MBT5021068.1 dephospho-CoA kinase [Planctomicrobium sp.]MDB4439601.1 dephospho-CoA kinase [Planctomicrobium sp.]MDB4732856.1 dephospho-CoA kinase [Planctomicrobium sp.]
MSAVPIPVIGIIGGIGSGKTAIAKVLGQIMSICILDADRAGHEVLKQPETKEALKVAFNPKIFDHLGEVNRSELARLVFGKEERCRQSLLQLNEITHPRIHNYLEEQLSELQRQQTCDVIILDAALLLEAGWSESCDAIVYLEVPEQIRLQRVQQRGWTEQQFRDREASQLPLKIKSEKSDVTIPNGGNIETAAQKLAIWIQSNLMQTATTSNEKH